MLNSISDFFVYQRLLFSRFIPRSVRGVAMVVLLLALTVGIANTNLPAAYALSGDLNMHDPSIIRVGNCYYGFSTGFQGGPGHGSPTIRKTCDTTLLTGWTHIGTVFSNTPAWITAALGSQPPNLWAPDINYWNGTYYLYYAGSLWGTSFAVMGLATATNIEGPWTDAGEVTRVNYPIDPNVVWGPGGVAYITWGSWTGNYGISMHVLDTTTGKLSTSNNTLWHIANGIENSTMSYNGGYYYLWGSKGTCCQGVNSTYYTVVGRSTSVTGPFLDQNGVDMKNGGGTIILTGSWPKVAAGGADEFDDPTYNVAQRLAYHYYDANNNGQPTLDIRTILYSHGWPVLTAPLSNTTNLAANAIITASSSYEGSGWSVTKVNDGQHNSITTNSPTMGWSSNNSLTTQHTEWIQFNLGSRKAIKEVDLYPRNDRGNIGQGFPIDFTIQVTTNSSCSSGWTTVYSATHYPPPSTGTPQKLTFASTSAYCVLINSTKLGQISTENNYYRLQFAEVEIYP